MSTAGAKSATATTTQSGGGKKKDGEVTVHPVLLRLERNDPTLTSLSVVGPARGSRAKKKSNPGADYFRPRTKEDWRRLGEALATNTHVHRLDLHHLPEPDLPQLSSLLPEWMLRYESRHSVSERDEFISGLNRNTSVRRLTLANDRLILGEVFIPMGPLFAHNASLTSLTCSGRDLGGERGADRLSLALMHMKQSLRYLDLSNVGMDDGALHILARTLKFYHPGLRSLELRGNAIGDRGCTTALPLLLRNPDSMLVRLYLDDNQIGSAGPRALAEALVGNNCLKTLSMHRNRPNSIFSGFKAFIRTVCNGPGIDRILGANHTLERLVGIHSDRLLRFCLHLNRDRNKSRAAGRKVVWYHFVHHCDLELFEKVPGGLVPTVLAMIGDHSMHPTGKNERTDAHAATHDFYVRDDYRHRHIALHRIIRLCPSICERHVDIQGHAGNVDNDQIPSAKNITKRARLS